MRPARRAWIANALGVGIGVGFGFDAGAVGSLVATAALGLNQAPPPLAARYAVTVETVTPGPARSPGRAQSTDWYFFRDASRIAVLKGAIDETWTRDAQGRIAFERTFHDHAKITDYSPGELLTLGLAPDWAALATFVDASELAGLQLYSSRGRGAALRLRLEGRSGTDMLRVDWLQALQLPALVLRRRTAHGRDGSDRSEVSIRIELLQHAATAPADWPQPGLRAANYLHLDAADFGDMDYEPVVRLSEALDVRRGWRQPHAHD